MSYIKNTWQSGDLISTEKLNNIQNGIAAAASAGEGGRTDSSHIVYFFLDDLVARAESQIDGLPISTFTDILQSGKSIIILDKKIDDYFTNTFYTFNEASQAAGYGAWRFTFKAFIFNISLNNFSLLQKDLIFDETQIDEGYINRIIQTEYSVPISSSDVYSTQHTLYPSESVPTV